MLDLGWSELLVVAVVLIVVVGPKDLPKMLRTFGKTTASLRKMAGDFRRQLDDALKESELDDVRKIAGDLKGLDPRQQIRESLSPLGKVGQDINKELRKAASEIEKKDKPAPTTEAKSSEREPYPWEVPAAEPVNEDALTAPAEPATAKPATAKTASTKSASAKSASAKTASAKTASAKPKPAPAKAEAAAGAEPKASRTSSSKTAAPKTATPKTATPKAAPKAGPAATADKPTAAKPATRRRTAAKPTGAAGKDET